MAEKSKGGAKKKSAGGKVERCWTGYERVPGKKAGEDGSCRKKAGEKGKQ